MTELRPMLASPGVLPTGDGWSFELKLDGVRGLISISESGSIKIETRKGNDVTSTFPELAGLGDALDGSSAVLDGEIVAFADDGKPSFHRLQERLGIFGTEAVRRSLRTPVVFVIFDIIELNGLAMRDLPLTSRRTMLDQLDSLRTGASWRTITVYDDGPTFLAATREADLEGIIAKRNDSRYTCGVRSPNWIKVKNNTIDEFVIGGWCPGEGRRLRMIGALLLGMPETDEPDAPLRFVGKVGTGFSDATLDEIGALLLPDVVKKRPFSNDPGERTAIWVQSRHACLVEFREWSPTGLLRFPSWRGFATAAS
jgi:bifunctional non-homologous end joining protein LigD